MPEFANNRLPVLASAQQAANGEFSNERDLLYKLFFDMKKDVTELKKMFFEMLQNPSSNGDAIAYAKEKLLRDMDGNEIQHNTNGSHTALMQPAQPVIIKPEDIYIHEDVEESLNIMDKEKELIIKALKKHKGKRKDASSDLGISERTLYRKLKEYDIEE